MLLRSPQHLLAARTPVLSSVFELDKQSLFYTADQVIWHAGHAGGGTVLLRDMFGGAHFTATGNTPTAEPGVAGWGISFNNTEPDSISVPHASLPPWFPGVINTPFTMWCEVSLASLPAGVTHNAVVKLTLGGGGVGPFFLFFSDTGLPQCFLGATASGPTTLAVGQVGVAGVRYDGTNADVWLNGIGGTPVSSSLTTNTSTLLLGTRNDALITRSLNGTIYGLGFYRGAFSDGEMRALTLPGGPLQLFREYRVPRLRSIAAAAPGGGRIMGGLAGLGGLAANGGLAGIGGGLAA